MVEWNLPLVSWIKPGMVLFSIQRPTSSRNLKESGRCWNTEFEESNVNETIAVEEKFNLKLDGAQFGGVIDRIDQIPAGEYIVIDYKTSKSPLSKNKMPEDVQLALYCQAVRERYGKYPIKAGLMYVNPKIRDLRLMDVDEAQINSVLDGAGRS
ncbi:MAG: DNA helicase II / ATP-dependent DNA helicase PcrA [Methanohalophilus sp. T328-1]|nr:MAG: DNA helicase II / ATP-dependent DNA helicase PcrA [Methanohalophilus sp. T328-1]